MKEKEHLWYTIKLLYHNTIQEKTVYMLHDLIGHNCEVASSTLTDTLRSEPYSELKHPALSNTAVRGMCREPSI
jgi:hypothetical protein